MMSECTHECSTCGESCSQRQEPQSLLKELNPAARVGKVYGVVSGKGGVGKSMTTCQLAVTMRRRGYQVGVLDADVTGPSIPKAFGLHQQATGSEAGMNPVLTRTGIQVMSTNLLLANETDPVIWRGPVISGVVQQFWTDVLWNCDYLFVDMPPGTGDVSLSVFQSIPLDGILIGEHGGGKGCEDGGDDGGSHPRCGGEHELCGLSGLRPAHSSLRPGQDPRGRRAPQPAPAGGNAHRPGPGRAGGRWRHRVL